LEQGPMYGYQLRAEFEQRTGSTWPLNVWQVHTTLTRLERTGSSKRSATMAALQDYTRLKRSGPSDQSGPEELAWGRVLDSLVFAAEAETRWFDHCEPRLRRAVRHCAAADRGGGPMNAAVELAAAARLPRAEDRWLRDSRERLAAGPRGRDRLAAETAEPAESAEHESTEEGR
jgi:hypothetical protein